MGREVAVPSSKADPKIVQIPEYETENEVEEAELGHQKAHEVIAVIPALNEEVAIGSVVLGALVYVDHVIVVDDGSSDKTAQMAELAGAQVIRMPKNKGKAKALMVGIREAERLKCRVAVTIDGDGQHRAEDIAAVVQPVLKGEADLVIGSRFMGEQKDIPTHRVMGQKVLNTLSNTSSKTHITDTQSGFRALSSRAIKNLQLPSDGYNIESDMIIHFAERNLTIKEVPIAVRYDVPNGHKQGSISMGMSLLGNVVSLIGYKRPLLLFGIPGVIFLAAGFILGFMTWLESFYIFTPIWQAFMSMGSLAIGIFFCVSALTLNSLTMIMKNARQE